VKSRKSVDSNDCVEVAAQDDGEWILVRDSKNQGGPVLRFAASEWSAFLQGALQGEFDREVLLRKPDET